MVKNNNITILLVEDNIGDVRLIQEAMKEQNFCNELRVANDGIEALKMLRQNGYSNPDLILLDLNLPKKNGREVLAEIKSDTKLKSIPVIVLTTSSAEEDIQASYNLHANCYVTKPVDFEQFISIIMSIENYWFSIVKLPKNEK